jgi:hypothetical protein
MGDSAGADAADERIIAVQVNTLLDRGRAESAVSAGPMRSNVWHWRIASVGSVGPTSS